MITRIIIMVKLVLSTDSLSLKKKFLNASYGYDDNNKPSKLKLMLYSRISTFWSWVSFIKDR